MRITLLILLLAVSATPRAELFNYTQDEYVTIRGVERCVNKAGWDNDQEINDIIIGNLLRSQGIPYDAEKLYRDEYWYQNKMPSSKRVDMEYDIAEIEKDCSQNTDIAKLTAQAESGQADTSLTVSMDELLDL